METVTLSGDDFKTIHNTLCELRSVQERITGVVSNDIADRIHNIIKRFETGLKDAYAQDDSVFQAKMDYYDQFKTDNSLGSIWSIYELPVHGFLNNHQYSSDAFVVYQGQHCAVSGSTWGDVYRAADHCIRNSGDLHHIFIEGFEVKNGNELHMYTGS